LVFIRRFGSRAWSPRVIYKTRVSIGVFVIKCKKEAFWEGRLLQLILSTVLS